MQSDKKTLGRMEQEQIDSNLRRIFDDDAEEELPDDLKALVDKLDDLDFPDAESELEGEHGSQADAEPDEGERQ